MPLKFFIFVSEKLISCLTGGVSIFVSLWRPSSLSYLTPYQISLARRSPFFIEYYSFSHKNALIKLNLD